MSQYTRIIQANADDGTYIIGGDDYSSSSTNLGNDYQACIRFTNVTVPNGAVITSAYIKGTSTENNADDVYTKIYGIDEDNTADFSSTPNGRDRTTAVVDWDETSVSTDVQYSSPDIKDIVQEIVNRGGWASGNAMGFYIIDDGSAAFNYYMFYDYSDDSAKAFALEINYAGSSLSPSISPSLSPSVSPSLSPSIGSSPSPSQSPSVSLSPSVSPSLSPSLSPSVSPSVSVSPSASPSVSPSPVYWGIKIKKESVNDDVENVTDPKDLVFTSTLGVLGLRLLDTVTAQTDSNGDIDTTDAHSFGYPPITIVSVTAYDGKQVFLPTDWHSIYQNVGHETVEVTENFSFSVDGTNIHLVVHAEEYNWDTDTSADISGRDYTFKIYYYFNEITELF